MQNFHKLLKDLVAKKRSTMKEEENERENPPTFSDEDLIKKGVEILKAFEKIDLLPVFEATDIFSFKLEFTWERHPEHPVENIFAELGERGEGIIKLFGTQEIELNDLIEVVQNVQKPHPFYAPVEDYLEVYAIAYAHYDDFTIISVYPTKEEAEKRFEILRNNPIDQYHTKDGYCIMKYTSTRSHQLHRDLLRRRKKYSKK